MAKKNMNRYAFMSHNRDMIGAGKKESIKDIIQRGPNTKPQGKGWADIAKNVSKASPSIYDQMEARKNARTADRNNADKEKENPNKNKTKDQNKDLNKEQDKSSPEKDI